MCGDGGVRLAGQPDGEGTGGGDVRPSAGRCEQQRPERGPGHIEGLPLRRDAGQAQLQRRLGARGAARHAAYWRVCRGARNYAARGPDAAPAAQASQHRIRADPAGQAGVPERGQTAARRRGRRCLYCIEPDARNEECWRHAGAVLRGVGEPPVDGARIFAAASHRCCFSGCHSVGICCIGCRYSIKQPLRPI